MSQTRSFRREFLGTLIGTARHLNHFIDARAQHELGLTGAQTRLMVRLMRHEGISQADLAADMEVRPISLSGLIDKLARQGLVERRSDAHDRRINRLYLSTKGRAIAAGINEFREEIAAEILGYANDATLRQALEALNGIKRRLREANENRPIAAE